MYEERPSVPRPPGEVPHESARQPSDAESCVEMLRFGDVAPRGLRGGALHRGAAGPHGRLPIRRPRKQPRGLAGRIVWGGATSMPLLGVAALWPGGCLRVPLSGRRVDVCHDEHGTLHVRARRGRRAHGRRPRRCVAEGPRPTDGSAGAGPFSLGADGLGRRPRRPRRSATVATSATDEPSASRSSAAHEASNLSPKGSAR